MQKYWYDGNGNMTRRIAGSVNYSQTWTVENMIADVRTCTTTAFTTCTVVASYGYDAGNARYKKTEGGATTIYFADIYEKNLNTGVTTFYYHFGGKRIALRKSATGAAVTYVHGDHLGSASVATDNAGLVVNQQRYRPYGEIEAGGTGMPSDHGFTGQRWQTATGLVHMAAREYDPVLGRFISADKIVPGAGNPQAYNRYTFVLNNPLRYVDPAGHNAEEPEKRSACKVLPQLCTPQSPPVRGDDILIVNESNVIVSPGGTLMSHSSRRDRARNGIAQIFAAIGAAFGGAASSVMQKLCADGDCANEVRGGVEVLRKIDGVGRLQNIAAITGQVGDVDDYWKGTT